MARKRKKVKIFGPLKESLEGALAFEKGQSVNLHVSELPPPPKRMTSRDVRELRRALNVSQLIFAYMLNVSPKAVQSWEQGARQPRDATLKLLAIAKADPGVLVRKV